MVVTVNGEERRIESETVAALLDELGYGSFVAVAVNRDVVRRKQWSETPLADGDAVEIVTPRQGG